MPDRRHERGGARGVDGETGTDKIEKIRDAIGCDTKRRTVIGIGIDGCPIAHLHDAVVITADSNIHARSFARQRGHCDAGIFGGFVCDFEQQALLRIRRRGFARADPEELRIESGRYDPESRPSAYSSARASRYPGDTSPMQANGFLELLLRHRRRSSAAPTIPRDFALRQAIDNQYQQ